MGITSQVTGTMRRFSRSGSNRDRDRNSQNSAHSAQSSTSQPGQGATHQSPPSAFHDSPHNVTAGTNPAAMNGGVANEDRPVSAATNSSFDFMGHRPVSGAAAGDHVQPSRAIASLSRTDQIVLKHFWDEKYADNAKRDLHFVSLGDVRVWTMSNQMHIS